MTCRRLEWPVGMVRRLDGLRATRHRYNRRMQESETSIKKALLGVGAALTLLTVVTGCGVKDAVKSAKGLPSASVMNTGTTTALEDQDIELSGNLKCSVNVGGGSVTKDVTGECSGVDVDGTAVTSTLVNGKYSDARDRCTATLVVKSADVVVSEVSNFDCAN